MLSHLLISLASVHMLGHCNKFASKQPKKNHKLRVKFLSVLITGRVGPVKNTKTRQDEKQKKPPLLQKNMVKKG